MCMQTSATAVSTHSQVRVYLVLLAPVLDWCGLVTSLVLERHVALSSHTDAFQRFQARGLNCLRASRKWDSRAAPPGPNGRATALQSSRLNTWRPRLCSSTLIDMAPQPHPHERDMLRSAPVYPCTLWFVLLCSAKIFACTALRCATLHCYVIMLQLPNSCSKGHMRWHGNMWFESVRRFRCTIRYSCIIA